LVNYTIDAHPHEKEEKVFNDDISVIIKPKVVEASHRKKKEIG
jgi:hypothetical protein